MLEGYDETDGWTWSMGSYDQNRRVIDTTGSTANPRIVNLDVSTAQIANGGLHINKADGQIVIINM